jgi:hypothetical protein
MGYNTQSVCLQILCLGGDSLLEMTKNVCRQKGSSKVLYLYLKMSGSVTMLKVEISIK